MSISHSPPLDPPPQPPSSPPLPPLQSVYYPPIRSTSTQAPPLFRPPSQQPLYKHRSWSPDIFRDEAWLKRKGNRKNRKGKSKSVTDDDLDELKACIELGFGFDSPEVDRRLSDTLPALELYYAVNKQYNDTVLKHSGSSLSDSESVPSPIGSPLFQSSDNPQTVKTRLKQWAQVVACSVRQSSKSSK